MKLRTSPLKTICPVLREASTQEQTLEVRLPDGYPDIGRIICGWGQVILRGKEWRREGIEANGGVQAWVLYAPEDGSDVRSVACWLPFRFRWELDANDREGIIRVMPVLRFVDARSLSARKLMVRAGIAMQAEAWLEETVQLPMPEETPGLELLKMTYPLMLDCAAGEKAFGMEETLTLPPSAPALGKLCYFSLQPRITECRVSGNRLILRGSAELHILYRSQEGQLHSWDFSVPFSQLAELDRVYEDGAGCHTATAVTSLELEPDTGGTLTLKYALVIQYRISQRCMVSAVEDAYSPDRPVTPDFEEMVLPVQLDEMTEAFHGEHTVRQEADILVDVGFLPDIPRQRRQENSVELELPGQFQVLYYGPDGALAAATGRWEGQYSAQAGENARVMTDVSLSGQPQGSLTDGEIRLQAEGKLEMRFPAEQTLKMVTGLELGDAEKKDPNRPSLILRRTGDQRLWDIAKSTGSTVSAIREANGIGDTPDPDRVLLIPVS